MSPIHGYQSNVARSKATIAFATGNGDMWEQAMHQLKKALNPELGEYLKVTKESFESVIIPNAEQNYISYGDETIIDGDALHAVIKIKLNHTPLFI
jgi:hypothetical protein